ncbi:MAG: hypothetical protein R3Y19_05035 [Rikenellaceae bacterium]
MVRFSDATGVMYYEVVQGSRGGSVRPAEFPYGNSRYRNWKFPYPKLYTFIHYT